MQFEKFVEKVALINMLNKENEERLQKLLKEIKPLQKYADYDKIPFEKIEKTVKMMCIKYCFSLQYLMFEKKENGDYNYYMSVKRDDTHQWIDSVHGITIYEVFAKMAIIMWRYAKEGLIAKRGE